MTDKQERWEQHFENFDKAYSRFAQAIENGVEHMSDLEKTGVAKHFEFAFEMARNTLKSYLLHIGFPQDEIRGPKYVIRKSFQEGFIRDGEVWMEALDFRNKTAHIYSGKILQDVLCFACEKFFPVLKDMRNYLKKEYDE